MKPTLALLLVAVAGGAPAVAVENAIPAPFPTERYAAMVAQSPFALATPVAPPPAAPERGFAADWYVTGLARYEDKDFVSIKSRDLATSFSLYGAEESNGITLVGVEWSTERGKSTVTIKKGGETARLEFNQAEIQSSAAPAPVPPAAPGQPAVPGRPIVPGQQVPPRPVVTPLQQPVPITNPVMQPPRAAIPRPTGAPVITQPAMTPGGAAPGAVSSEPSAGDNRRRIRVINPK
jgi:hypothetical protein